jgi:hypothetical protein
VVASHLLGEIERICDQLVAIEGGRLLRADTITSFTQVSQVLAVEVEEGWQQLRRAGPPRPGAGAVPEGLLVPLAGDDTYDVVRDALPTSACRCAGWSSGGTRSKSCSATRQRRPSRRAGAVDYRRRCPLTARPPPTLPAPPSRHGGVIHDLGYRGYDGPGWAGHRSSGR